MDQLNPKWMAIGAIVMILLNQVENAVLLEPLGIPLMNSVGLLGGLLIYALILAVGSFFVGGIIIGKMSPGVTIKEAGYASVAAVAVNVVFNLVTTGHFPGIVGIAIAAGIGYGLGVAGAKVGEAWQAKIERQQVFPHAVAVQSPSFQPPQDGYLPQGSDANPDSRSRGSF